MAHLSVFSPDGPHVVEILFPLEKEQVVIGRDPGCDLVLGGVGASRRHALIQWLGSGWMLVDQGSANGTLVQGQRITTHNLRNGDTLQMGDSRLVFVDGPDQSQVPQWIWCSHCGAAAAPGTWACEACGQVFGGAHVAAPKKKGGGCLWFGGCGCLGVLLLIAGLVIFILWRAGGIEGLTRRSISPSRAAIREGSNPAFEMSHPSAYCISCRSGLA